MGGAPLHRARAAAQAAERRRTAGRRGGPPARRHARVLGTGTAAGRPVRLDRRPRRLPDDASGPLRDAQPLLLTGLPAQDRRRTDAVHDRQLPDRGRAATVTRDHLGHRVDAVAAVVPDGARGSPSVRNASSCTSLADRRRRFPPRRDRAPRRHPHALRPARSATAAPWPERPVEGTDAVAARAPTRPAASPGDPRQARHPRRGSASTSQGGSSARNSATSTAGSTRSSPPRVRARVRAPGPTRDHPIRVDTLIYGAGIQGEDRGRIERRVLDGRSCTGPHPPRRDRRHDQHPARRPHPHPLKGLPHVRRRLRRPVPGGKATATAHLRDGHEVTRSLHVE